VKNYLIQELKDPLNIPFTQNIIFALKNRYSKDLMVYDAIVHLYEHLTPDHEGSNLFEILSFIKRFRLARTKEIAFEVLALNQWQPAVKATEILLARGVKQNEIVKRLLPHFKSGNPALSEAAFAVFAEHISADYLPTADEILDVYVQERSTHNKVYHTQDMPSIAIKTGIHFMENRLYDLLEHNSDNVRMGILAIISGYFDKGSYYFFKFLTPKLIDRYWELAHDSNEFIASKSITLIGMIGLLNNRVDYIDDLLMMSREAKNDYLKRTCMEAINIILHRIPYQAKIETFYLECLNHGDESLWSVVLGGLRFSPNRTFKDTLWQQYKDHSSSAVRDAAQKLLKPTYRRWMVLRHLALLMSRKLFGDAVYNYLQNLGKRSRR
jgi:hypothetical protein